MAIEIGHGDWVAWDGEWTRTVRRELRRWLGPALLGLLLCGLFLGALRGNILQMRYLLDASHRQESALKKERAALTAHYWKLRDPGALGARARDAFVVPDCVVDLPADAPRGTALPPGCAP
jgi:cell division protein FtsB